MGFILAKKVWDEEGMGGLRDRPKKWKASKKDIQTDRMQDKDYFKGE